MNDNYWYHQILSFCQWIIIVTFLRNILQVDYERGVSTENSCTCAAGRIFVLLREEYRFMSQCTILLNFGIQKKKKNFGPLHVIGWVLRGWSYITLNFTIKMQAITSKARFDIRQTWPFCFHLFQPSTICCFFIFNYVDFFRKEEKNRTELHYSSE